MARLTDMATVVRRVGIIRFGRRVWSEVLDDHLFIFSAALAYSWLFAIFPFFIFLVNLAPLFLDERPEQREAQVRYFLNASLPDPAVETLMQKPIVEALQNPSGGLLSISLLIALWAASKGIAVTMAVLDKCYEIERPRAYYKRRPMAFGLTIGCTLLVCAVMLLLPVGRMFRQWYMEGQEGYDAVLFIFDAGRITLAIIAVLTILSLLYHFGPCVRHRFHWITPGAVFCLLTWILLGYGFKLYVALYAHKGYGQTYGNVGGVAILLLLFYVDALVLLIGAEINSEVDFEILKVERGSRDFVSCRDSDAVPSLPAQ